MELMALLTLHLSKVAFLEVLVRIEAASLMLP